LFSDSAGILGGTLVSLLHPMTKKVVRVFVQFSCAASSNKGFEFNCDDNDSPDEVMTGFSAGVQVIKC
jgi:hypothetical protein